MDAAALRAKRVARPLLVLVAGMVVLTGCPPPPGPPAPPATILDAWVTPTVTAGEPVTATVRASHHAGIHQLGVVLSGPAGAYFREEPDDSGRCGIWEIWTVVDSAPGESEVFTGCTVPAYANNGTWTATITIRPGGGHQISRVTRTFEVVGGTDDYEAPVITALSAPPATVARGETFPLAFRIEDLNLAPDTDTSPLQIFHENWYFSDSAGTFNCTDHTTTQVSATVVETSMSCTVKPDQRPGRYLIGAPLSRVEATDLLGFHTVYEASFYVT